MEFNSDDTTYSELCACGRSFVYPGALKTHQHSCSRSKKCLAGALEKAKEIWTSRKKKRVENLGRAEGLLLQLPTHALHADGVASRSEPAGIANMVDTLAEVCQLLRLPG